MVIMWVLHIDLYSVIIKLSLAISLQHCIFYAEWMGILTKHHLGLELSIVSF